MNTPRHPSPWLLLLVAALAWLRSTAGQVPLDCPKMEGLLGANTLLPLSWEGGRGSHNTSMSILVTMTNSSDSKVFSKIISVELRQRDAPTSEEGRYRLHRKPLSLEILRSQREDEGWYLTNLVGSVKVQQVCWQLRLHEQVSDLELEVVNKSMLRDGNCNMTLKCLAHRGDSVTYSWSLGRGSPPLDTANGSQLLQLLLGPQDTDRLYVCTASNPVSNTSKEFRLGAQCSMVTEPSQWSLKTVLLPIAALVAVLGMAACLLLLRRRRMSSRSVSDCPGAGKRSGHLTPFREKAEQDPAASKAQNRTIYTQVHGANSLHAAPVSPAPPEDSCTTIYVAASAPASSPAQLDPHPCPPGLSAITFYANTALPES